MACCAKPAQQRPAIKTLPLSGSMLEKGEQKMCACRLHDRMPVLLTSDEQAEAWLATEPLSAKYVCLIIFSRLYTAVHYLPSLVIPVYMPYRGSLLVHIVSLPKPGCTAANAGCARHPKGFRAPLLP